ncbi:MAG TPA: M56 family metallopeptidase, partial [Pirellulales bacterium]|nr:M56 family metallopeptidase [Pirellulales bacterium]
MIWLIGSAILLAKLAIGCSCLARILAAARPNEDAAIEESFAQAGRALQLEKLPELVLSDWVSGPFSAGLIRPRIVLPERLLGRVTPRQLRAIFLHEVAHVVRRDQAIVMLQNVAAALFWLHPLVKALNRQLSQAREEVCDNYVLAATDAPSYSRTLLTLARLVRSASPLPGAVGLFTSRWKLESRVAGLLDERRSRSTCLTRRGRAFVCVIAVALAAVTAFGTISIAVEDDDAGKQGSSGSPAPDAATENPAVNEQTETPPDDGLLTLRLKVRMPDGSPAAQA